MNFHIFLRDGKWYGNEFPEYPPKPGPMSHQEFFTEYYQDDLPKYRKEVETAKSTALEIVNSEVMAEKTEAGRWFINPYPGSILTEPLQVKDGELYPWDGEVEKGKRKCKHCRDTNSNVCIQPEWYFELLPKQKETEKIEVLITMGQTDMKTNAMMHDLMSRGIVATGVPEQDLALKNENQSLLEQLINETGKCMRHAQTISDQEKELIQAYRDIVKRDEELAKTQEELRLSEGEVDMGAEEVKSIREELAKAKEEKDLLFEWKDSMMKLWGPIIDFMQDFKNSKALGLRPGDLLSEKILEMLKNKVG